MATHIFQPKKVDMPAREPGPTADSSVSLPEAETILLELAAAFPLVKSETEESLTSFFKGENLSTGVALSEVDARYRTLVEQIPAVVFMAFLDKGIGEAYVSPQIEAMLGFSQEEWLNDPVRWYQQIHPDDKARWSIEAADLFVSGQSAVQRKERAS